MAAVQHIALPRALGEGDPCGVSLIMIGLELKIKGERKPATAFCILHQPTSIMHVECMHMVWDGLRAHGRRHHKLLSL